MTRSAFYEGGDFYFPVVLYFFLSSIKKAFFAKEKYMYIDQNW